VKSLSASLFSSLFYATLTRTSLVPGTPLVAGLRRAPVFLEVRQPRSSPPQLLLRLLFTRTSFCREPRAPPCFSLVLWNIEPLLHHADIGCTAPF
jgi:hypothetical protein